MIVIDNNLSIITEHFLGVFTPVQKSMSQIGSFPPIGVNSKNLFETTM